MAADQSAEALRAQALRMALTLAHRGPDEQDAWSDPRSGIALGHSRLSIQDLSPAGHQPMASPDGRFHIVFNGEVYNHLEHRKELGLPPASYRGHSDTETLLAGFTAWGIEATIRKSVGMFAVAVWDSREQELWLIRDRLGIKPLYYARHGSWIGFASELKPLRIHPAYLRELDAGATSLYLKHGYVPTPYSIDRGTRKLPPGCLLRLTREQTSLPEPQPYWSMREVARPALDGNAHPARDRQEIVAELERRLADAVKLRLLSDVPLGAFLSGGIDSSLVVALMRQFATGPVKTFSIGFEVPEYNEAPYARKVAEHLQTDHTEHCVTAREAMDVIPRLPAMYDEPFADSSQIPTFLVSQLARQHVTVALSGDGGDEVFCGYRRYFYPLKGLWLRQQLPNSLFVGLSNLCYGASRFAPGSTKRLFRGAGRLFADSNPETVYIRNMCYWHAADGVLPGVTEPPTLFGDPASWPNFPELQRRWMWLDTLTYLPDDILTKVDRASMAVSLEARVPLLDHRVVEYAWSLPLREHIAGGQSKSLLREILARHVPRTLFERPKVGFGVPLGEWLRGPLRDWASDLLDSQQLASDGIFDPQPITRRWQEHLAGHVDWKYWLWPVLMFQAWQREMRQSLSASEPPLFSR